jgi:hypothetical protein
MFLIFYGQLEEMVKESQKEKLRMRRFSIIYDLQSHKINIIEKKEDNSGILQGKFLKPQHV